MTQYIDKDALVAEIKERIETYNKGYANGDDKRADALDTLLHDLNNIEAKEVDLKKEFNEYFFNFTDPETGEKLKRKECWLDIKQARKFAKHFFELGLKAQKGE